MKNSKLLIGIFLFLASFSFVNAQEIETKKTRQLENRESRENRRFGKLSEKLDLSAEQKKSIYELMQNSKKESKAMKSQFRKSENSNEEDRALIKSEQQKLRANLDAEIMTVLNEEQRAAYTTLIEERDARINEHQEHRELLRSYTKENIQPVLLAQRKKLENVITPEDQAIIAELRSNISSQAFKGKGKRNAKRGEGNKMSKDERTSLKALVDKYKSDIEALHEEIADEQEEWKAYKESIRPAKKDDNSDQDLKPNKRMDKKEGKGYRKYGAFLLMDLG